MKVAKNKDHVFHCNLISPRASVESRHDTDWNLKNALDYGKTTGWAIWTKSYVMVYLIFCHNIYMDGDVIHFLANKLKNC